MVTSDSLYQNKESQYIVHLDPSTGAWRIYDMWHPAIHNLLASDPNPDIPDDNPGVIILKEGAYGALVSQAAKIGALNGVHEPSTDPSIVEELDNANVTIAERENELGEKNSQIEELRSKLQDANERAMQVSKELDIERGIPKSEGYRLKKDAIDALLKLAAMGDISNGLKG